MQTNKQTNVTPCTRQRGACPPEEIATIRAYRRTGGAIVNVARRGRTRRYVVSLKRYRALKEWTLSGCPWKTSGAWFRNSTLAHLWADSAAGAT